MKKLPSLPMRLWLPTFIITAFSALLVGSNLWRSTLAVQQVETRALTQVKQLVSIEKHRIEQLLKMDAHASVVWELAQISDAPAVELCTLVDLQMNILYSAQPSLVGKALTSSYPGVDEHQARKSRNENRLLTDYDSSHKLLLAYQPITLILGSNATPHNAMGLLVLKYDLSKDVSQVLRSYKNDLFIHLSFTLLIAIALTYLTNHWFFRPLTTIQNIVNRISMGEFTAKVNLGGTYELATLSLSIEHMQKKLQLAEQTARETEQYFKDTFRLMPAALALITDEGKFIDCSEAFCQATGYSREETIGRRALELHLWNLPEQRVAMRAMLAREGRVTAFEYELRNRNGKTTTMQMSACYVFIGGSQMLVSAAHDISKIKNAEAALHESEKRFKDTFRRMPAALALYSEQGVFIDCSEVFCKATGYRRDEMVGKSALNLGLWAQPEQRTAMRTALMRDGQVDDFEYKLHHRDGSTTMMQMSARHLVIGGERLLLSFAHDISERKNVEMALIESEERFQDTFRLMPAALALHSEQGTLLDCSEVFCKATGYNRKELLGRNAIELSLWAQPKERRAIIKTLLRDGKIDGFEYQLRHRDGSINIMQMSARHLLIGGERLTLSFAHDISARKKADADLLVVLDEKTALLHKVQKSEAVLREAKIAAEIANKSKSEFLASMSHEIRTPINGVLGLAQLLSETPLNGEQQEFVKTILTSGNALMTILNDILDLSKMEAGKMVIEFVPYKPLQLMTDVVNAMKVLADQKGILLTSTCAPDVPAIVSSDPTRIRQILFNLLGNAVKFTQEGRVDISLKIEGQKLHFEIQDTGIGIAKEKQPTLFQMFTQENASTSRTFGGSGLGLAISKQLVSLMGGDIGFKSEKNVGSLFWVTLPLKMVDDRYLISVEERENTRQKLLASTDFINCRVLLVDDNDVNLMVTGGMLKKIGLSFDTAHNGIEAIDKVFNNTYNAILMDCEMPELDGYDTTREIRRREQLSARASDNSPSSIPIIALTANAMSDDRQRCLDSGMNEFLSKPLNIDKLHSMLSKAIFSHPSTDRRKNKP